MKHAICIGINDYSFIGPAASLRGCIRDAREWADLLADVFDFRDVHLLTDGAATPDALQSAIARIAERAKPGDTVCLSYSGHGTRVPDADGDEEDGYDEAIVLSGALYTDDQLAGDLKVFAPGVKVVVIADSCHSGTVTRALPAVAPDDPHPLIPRFTDFLRGGTPAKLHHRFGAPRGGEEDADRVLLAGCHATETSADAWLAGEYHGALSFHATRLLRENPWRTWRDFGKLLRPCVKRTSTQTPQLEGADAALDLPAFGGVR